MTRASDFAMSAHAGNRPAAAEWLKLVGQWRLSDMEERRSKHQPSQLPSPDPDPRRLDRGGARKVLERGGISEVKIDRLAAT